MEVSDFYAALVESNDDAIVAKDVDGVVIAWNPAAERLFGWTAAEMEGQSIRRLLPPDRQDEEALILERIRAGERVGQFFTKRLHKDGRLLDVSVTVSPVRDASGKIIGASKIARDAGPHLENRRRLRESEERFRMLADNISQIAWIADPEGEIVWLNKRWYEYTGLPPEVPAPELRRAFLPDEHRDRVQAHFRRSIETGEAWEDTFPLRRKDGQSRWFLSRAMPIRGETGEITWWFGTNTDITEQREQAEQIRVLLLEVNHRSKNMLSVVQALARRSADGDKDFVARFEARLRSLAVNQDILVRRAWREVPMHELVEGQLAFFGRAPGELAIAGPDCALLPRAAEIVGMALHELATNSLKHGALASAGGHVTVGWDCPPGAFTAWWHESGGAAVRPPERTGFGTTVIRDVPRRALDAAVELEYTPEGLRWSIACDRGRVLAGDEEAAPG